MTIGEVSRRGFLKGAMLGAVGAGVAGSGLVGCGSPKQASTAASGSGAAAGASGDVIAAAQLNPQDYDYRGNTTDFKTLLSSWKLGKTEIAHRMCKSAAGSATFMGGYTDELRQYYLNFAKGGVDMIWIECDAITVPKDGSPIAPEAVEFFKKFSAEVATYGSHLGYQWAPMGADITDMTVETIQGIQDIGAQLAVQLKDMGFIAIEINSAGFNQGHRFLSRFYNKRTDQYGAGSIENRARFDAECIQKIHAAAGDDFAVQILMDCVEENDNLTNDATLMTLDNAVTAPHNSATTIQEGIALAKELEKAGAASFHLRLGPLGNHPCQFGSDLYFLLKGVEGATGYGTQWDFKKHFGGKLIGNHSGAGMLFNITEMYKKEISVPVGCVTYMDPAHAPDFFEAALADGKVDFYMMNRPFTVDPEYVNKLREKRIDEIAPCTRCLHCHIGSNPMNAKMGYCRVNALTQRVMREGGPATYELPPASSKKKVMVVGAGPAGMEAARIAALRGHDVTLYEKKGAVGGSMEFAANVKGEHENLKDLIEYLKHQCELAGVTTKTGTEVTSDSISKEAPDALVIATGGVRPSLDVSGTTVVKLEDFMMTETGENVVVYGSSAQAFDAALWLTVHKKKVNIVTPNTNDELDMQQSQHAHRFMTTALYALGVKAWPESTIKSAKDGKLTISSAVMGVDVEIDCDAIVNAGDMEPNEDISSGTGVKEVYIVGDAKAPFNIGRAIQAGNDAGRAI